MLHVIVLKNMYLCSLCCTYIHHHWESNQEAEETDHCNEDLLSVASSEELREQVHSCCHKSLHTYKLKQEQNHKKTKITGWGIHHHTRAMMIILLYFCSLFQGTEEQVHSCCHKALHTNKLKQEQNN